MPINYTFRGDKEKALRLSKLADLQLKTLLDHMKFQNLQQYRRVVDLSDGTRIICTSQFGQHNIIVDCPVSVPSVTVAPLKREVSPTLAIEKIYLKCTFNNLIAQYGGENIFIFRLENDNILLDARIWTDLERPNSNHIGLTRQGFYLKDLVSGIKICLYDNRNVSSTLTNVVNVYANSLTASLSLTDVPHISPSVLWKAYKNISLATTIITDQHIDEESDSEPVCGGENYTHHHEDYSVTYDTTLEDADFTDSINITKKQVKSQIYKSSFKIFDADDGLYKKRFLLDINITVPPYVTLIEEFNGNEIVNSPPSSHKILGAAHLTFGTWVRNTVRSHSMHPSSISYFEFSGSQNSSGSPCPTLTGEWLTSTKTAHYYESIIYLMDLGQPGQHCEFWSKYEWKLDYSFNVYPFLLTVFF